MKIICSPGYHHNDPVATHALGHMMYGFTNNIGVPKRRKYITSIIFPNKLCRLVYIKAT